MNLCKILLGRIKIFCYQKIRVKFCSTIICAQYHLRHQHHHLEGAQAMRYLALLLWLQEVRSAGIYSWVHEIAPCSPTAMRLKPWECQHRGGPLRHSVAEPGAEWQNWSPQSFQAPYCRGGRLKHRDLPFPTHHNNSAQCARIPRYSQFHLFPLPATISKGLIGNTTALSLVVDCQSRTREHHWWGAGAPGVPTISTPY